MSADTSRNGDGHNGARADGDLAQERARITRLTRLVSQTAENLSRCLVALDGPAAAVMDPRILRKANLLGQALIIALAEVLNRDGGNLA